MNLMILSMQGLVVTNVTKVVNVIMHYQHLKSSCTPTALAAGSA